MLYDMNIKNYQTSLSSFISGWDVMSRAKLQVLDIGCSGGIDNGWGQFQPHVQAYGIDPQGPEIKRLQRGSTAWQSYLCAKVGSGADVFKGECIQFRPFHGSTAWKAAEMEPKGPMQSNSIHIGITEERLNLEEIHQKLNVTRMDFIKIDTDGYDLDILKSWGEPSPHILPLGFLVEVNWWGGADEDSNTYHNIDRWMKARGFQPYGIEINMYGRASLPRPFKYEIFGPTIGGIPVQGDVLFLRDRVQFPISGTADVIKYAAIAEAFGLDDVAAEILLDSRETTPKNLDITEILDNYAKRVDPHKGSYQKLVTAFDEDPREFFPKKELFRKKNFWEGITDKILMRYK